MKRLLIVLLSVLLLCGCAGQQGQEVVVQMQTTTEETTIPEETEQTTKAQITEYDYDAAYEEWLERIQNPMDGEGMVPLLFVDTGHFTQTAFVICAGKDGEYYISDLFLYNDAPLYEKESAWFYKEPEGELTANFMDFDRNICFTDFRGNSFTTKVKSLSAHLEDIVPFIKVQADLQQEAPTQSQYYLGTYEDVPMFPTDAVYTDTSVTVDLDGDGTMDKVTVILTEDHYTEDKFFDYKGYYYDHEMVIERNGETFTFEQYAEYDQVAEGHDRVFVADVDLDGEYEIVRYDREHLRFDGVSIYDFNGTEYEQEYYVISPQP